MGRLRMSGAALATAAAFAASGGSASAVVAGPDGAQRDPYEIFTIGDSAAAGEGAPDVEGRYTVDGDPVDADRDGDFEFEDWDTRFDGSPAVPGVNQDSTRCHRSGHTSTSAVARDLLQQEFPDVVFDWLSVACSGASIVQTGTFGAPPPNKGGVLRGYDGVDSLRKRGIAAGSLSPAVYPPQLEQLNTILAARPAGPTKRIDALVMNLGINDAGFGPIVTECLDIDSLPDGECHFHDNNKIPDFAEAKLGLLDGRFDRLAAALDGAPIAGKGDPALTTRPAEVFLTALPNPLRPTATTLCDGQPPNNYEANLALGESAWLEANVFVPLNDRMQTEADQHGWRLVDAHVNEFVGHAICTLDDPNTPEPEPWVRTNLSALTTQGELDETDGLPVAVGGSIVHPNPTGYAHIGAALRARMRPFVVDRYTPDAAPRVTTLASATDVGVSLSDAALTSLRSGYWHRLKLRQLSANGSISTVTGPDGLRDLGYGTTSTTYTRTGRYLVAAQACGPLSRDATKGCGPVSAELRVSTFVPARPVNVAVVAGDAPAAVLATPGFSVSWEHADDLALHDTRRSVVRVRRKDTGKVVQTKTIEGSFTSAVIKDLTANVPFLVSVKACNDGDRCSAFTTEVEAQAKKGQKPFSGLFFELQKIEVALKGLPCSTAPVPFDPQLGTVVPGLEGPAPTIQPSCPGDIPIGRLTLTHEVLTARPGRAVTLSLRWRHPRRWQALHDVTVRIGGLATLRFDQDAGTLSLGRGSRSRGPSVPVGRAGTLSAGGVKVRVPAGAVRGSGATGASVHLSVRVVLPRATRSAVLSVAATDDTGQVQGPVPVGLIRVR